MKQRAKLEWLQEGDKNTKSFHACVKEKKCRNRIEQIEDGTGRAYNSQISIEQTFIEFYTNLFTTVGANNIEACIQVITQKVTPKMNT
jgi:hypothetical protein